MANQKHTKQDHGGANPPGNERGQEKQTKIGPPSEATAEASKNQKGKDAAENGTASGDPKSLQGKSEKLKKSEETKKSESAEKSDKELRKAEKQAEKRKRIPFFRSNRFKRGGISTLTTVVVIALIVLVNMLTGLLSDRYPSINPDLTPQGLNSLTDKAIEAAKAVETDTEILILFPEDTAKGTVLGDGLDYSQVVNLANRLSEVNRKLKVSYQDLDSDPTLQRDYELDGISPGGVIFRNDSRYHYLSMVGDLFTGQTDQQTNRPTYLSRVDGSFTNALLAVNSDVSAKASFITGHNETLTVQNRGSFEKLLEGQLYTVEEFNLLTSEIPEDTDLLILPGPTTDLTREEIQKLRTFLADASSVNDHSLLYMANPGVQTPQLDQFLEEWGVEIAYGYAIERDKERLFAPGFDYMLGEATGDLLTEQDYPVIASPFGTAVKPLFDYNDDISVSVLWQSSPQGGMVVDGNTPIEEVPEEQLSLATISRKMMKSDGSKYASVAVFGSAGAFSDSYANNNTFSNREYSVDLLSLMTNIDTVSNYVAQVPTNSLDIVMDQGMVRFMGFGVFTVLLPLAILTIGLVIFFRRRYR